MKNKIAPLLLTTILVLLASSPAHAAGELARSVRMKISAGDFLSAEAMVEDYGRDSGQDAEYLSGLAWLARGALVLGLDEKALLLAKNVRALLPAPSEDNLTTLGAAIEVEAQILARRQGKDAALRFLDMQRRSSSDPAFQSRLWKNSNLLSLVSTKAPEIVATDHLGPEWKGLASLEGKPVVLFLWAHWCGDCKDQAATLAKIRARYEPKGVVFVAPTRFYGTGKDRAEATPAEEKEEVAAVLAASYKDLGPISVPFSTEAMLRYGASATPTFVFIDRRGIVRSYTATRLSEAELSARIENVLASP